MQGYTIYKAGKAYVVQAEGKDVLICKSRRDAEQMVCDASGLLEEWTSKGHPGTESAE
ncbi:MAG: hypothetical protein ABI076_04425 [Acidobacteriaceae bacterium]